MTSAAKTAAKNDPLMRDTLVDELHDVLRGCSRQKNPGDTGILQAGNVRFGDDPAEEHGDVVHALFVQQAHELRAKRVVCAGKDGKPDDVDVRSEERRVGKECRSRW